MTQQFENFVNAALDKSLSSDVTLPTANEIPVFTGIGRQVTGKTKAELGLDIWQAIPTNTSITLVAGLRYIANNTALGQTYTLPASPTIGQVVHIKGANFGTYKQTVARNGSTINGAAANYSLTRNGSYRFLFNASSTWEAEYLEELTWPYFRANTYYPAYSIIHSGDSLLFNPAALTTGAAIDTSQWNKLCDSGKVNYIQGSQNLSSGMNVCIGALNNSGAAYATAMTLTLPTGDFAVNGSARQEPITIYTGNYTGALTFSAPDAVLGITDCTAATGATTLTLPTNTRGMIIQLIPFYNTGFTQWGWKVHYSLGQEIRMGSTSPVRFAKDTATDSFMRLELAALSAGTKVWTVPNADINFGDLPSVATTNSNVLAGTRTSILGAAFNTVSGTDCSSLGTRGTDPASPTFGTRNTVQGVGNVTLGGESNSIYSTIGNNTLVGCSKVTMISAAFNNTLALGVSNAFVGGFSPTTGRIIYLGSSISPLDNGAVAAYGAALGAICCVYTGAAIINGSTYNCTLDGNNTLTASNCAGLLLLNTLIPNIDVPSSATYDIEFIVTIGTLSGSTLEPRRTLFAKRRVYALRNALNATYSSTITLDSDVSLGEAATGSVSVGVTVDFANNRLVPTITGTTGTNQTYMQASVRVVTHINRK